MKFIFLAIILFSCSTLVAQIDNSSKKVIINNTGTKTIDNSSNLSTGNLFSNTKKTINFSGSTNPMLKDPNKGINFSDKDPLHDPSELYANKFKGTQDKKIKPEYMNHQYLGDFKTGSKHIQVICRDFEYVDGDRVSITVNGIVVQPNVLLEANYKSYFINLEDGFNTIDFTALNQGSSGPNTADFKVYDENGKVMAQNQWNLLTGVKATLIVVKEKP